MSSSNRAQLVNSLAMEVRKFIAGAILFNEKVAASVGMNSTDLQFINLLQLEVARTPGDLARWSGLTTGGVTVALDRLERAGFIKRQPNPDDRRSTIIKVVETRLRPFLAIYQTKGDLLMGAMETYTDRELALILDFLRRTSGAEA
jgi:DNA-binding MarR family transcriptional regulator